MGAKFIGIISFKKVSDETVSFKKVSDETESFKKVSD